MQRMFTVVMVTGLALLAYAFAPAIKVFDTNYGVKSDSNLGKMKCAVCHATKMGGKKLNAYGHDLQSALKAANAKAITPEVLKKVEAMDSDKDGVKNIDEIRADKAPGG